MPEEVTRRERGTPEEATAAKPAHTRAHQATGTAASEAASEAAPVAAVARAPRGSMVRKIAPAIPLAIALATAAVHTTHTGSQAGTAGQATGTVATSSDTTGSASNGVPGPITAGAPVPLLSAGHPVDWWFVFKLNSKLFPKCGGGTDTRACTFDTNRQPTAYANFSQRYVVASSETGTLADGGPQCLGTSTSDPVGASFDEVYHGGFHFVVWNDQPYGAPAVPGCSGAGCSAPWGHSKGMLAWNDAGQGFVMQVSTPSWPLAASASFPRTGDGNTLGCVNDNDVQVSQHFFALRLNKADLVMVLKGLGNASVVTDPTDKELVNNGGPDDVQALVSALGKKSASTALVTGTLSSGIRFIAKPSDMNVPPWQMVSAVLGGVGLRTATWWASPTIPSTTAASTIKCWDESLGTPGPVEVATTGAWGGQVFSLEGGLGTNFNHAKIGVNTSGTTPYAIFGDENQQGTLSGANCASSQNGRGGTFFAVNNAALQAAVTKLIAGETAPAE